MNRHDSAGGASRRPIGPLKLWHSGKLFRDDFYYQLCSDVIHVPRQRQEEDPDELRQLVEHLLTGMMGEPGRELAAPWHSVAGCCQRSSAGTTAWLQLVG